MKKKRILAVLPSIYFYGKERANFEVYKLLHNAKDVNLSIVVNKNADRRLLSAANLYSSYKILFADRSPRRFKYLRYLIEVIISNIEFIFILLRNKPDVIFLCTENTFYDYFIPLIFTKTRIVYRIGDEPAFPKLSNYTYNSFVWRHLICKKVDTFVCVSRYVLGRVNELGRKSESDRIIYSVPPTRQLDSKIKFNFETNQRPHIGYLGQIAFEKGVDKLLEAAIQILSDGYLASFFFAGKFDYEPEFSSKIEKLYRESNCTDKIHFLGEIDDVNTFFNNMDFICIPSVKEEPLANVLVEAKYHKKPCIIFKSGGLTELITHNVDGLICHERTTDSLVKQILFYIEFPRIVNTHAENSYNSIKILDIDYESYKKHWYNVFELN